MENKHIVLRFPVNEKKQSLVEMPDMGRRIRRGKSGYWIPMDLESEWELHLLKTLDILIDKIKDTE